MVCPFCGHTTDARSDACSACGRTLPPRPRSEETTGLSRPPSVVYSDDGPTISPPSPTRATRGAGPLTAGQTINARYHVIKLLGQGGMGAVYQAWDEELGVAVAMKCILPAADEDPGVVEDLERRFKKELLLARQITHKNVVRIHDIGEFSGIKFITMPYVKGEDLATTLKGGPLPVPRVLALARQIASGLAAAHDAGVVHRDLKPANIMVEDGDFALLMDFGIARSVRQGTAPGTMAGTVVGTLEYMAPEQARAEAVDARADVYAFGLILYEMLVGRRQLLGDGAVADLVSRMNAAPPAVRTLNGDVPPGLDAVVTRCTQPAPEDRYQSAAEIVEALNGLDAQGHTIVPKQTRPATTKLVAAASALIMAAAGVTYYATGGTTVIPTERSPVSILVADFENGAKDPIFDETLEQALQLTMEGAPFVTIYSRTAAQRIANEVNAGTALDADGAQGVARREGIQVVLAGSVEARNGGYMVGVRALDAATGSEIMTASAEAEGKDEVLSAVNRLAASVRRALGDATPEAEQVASAETFTAASLEAASLYERAQILLRSSDNKGAIAAYERAIALDPGLGRAYAGLAAAHANAGQREDADRSYKLALERLDRMSERERYRTRSSHHLFMRNPQAAIEELTELVEKYPADSAGLGNLAFAWFLARDMAKAREVARKVTAIYSQNLLQRSNAALYAMYAGEFDAARAEAEAVLKLNERHHKALFVVAISHIASGRIAEAASIYERLKPVSASLALLGLADIALYEGRMADAAPLLETGAAADGAEGNVTAAARKLTALARVRRLQGRPADALRLARQAVRSTVAFDVEVEAALEYIELGQLADATAAAGRLRGSLQPDPQAYARVIEGLILLARKQPREAVTAFTDAQKIADTWLGRFGLGRAFLDLGAFTEAYGAFEACLRRRGEAASLFLDDLPTYHRLPPVHYYLGLAQQALDSPAAAESFRTFLAIKKAGDDPLAADARKRLGL